MKILILGGDGMLGHQLFLSLQKNYDVKATLHQSMEYYQSYNLFHSYNSYCGIDVRNDDQLRRIFIDFNPQVLINAIGLVKQRNIAKEAIPNLEINALLPHRLAVICEKFNTRLVHISTDCVFSGKTGNYTETDESDAEDLYGKTKFLGEVKASHCVTLRTSFIGLELARKTSLLEWFLAQHGPIKGYCRAIYSGLSTLEMSRVLDILLTKHINLTGVWHVASEPISKYDLLTRLAKLLKRNDIHILPDEEFICDRSLNGQAFAEKTGYKTPAWDFMLAQLAEQIMQRKNSHYLANAV